MHLDFESAEERIRKTVEIPLDHLTASDNESQRTVYVTVYRDADLARDTAVKWTGAAAAAGRRFTFVAPPELIFEPADRLVTDAVSVQGGGGF
jgi:hypothetical protein